METSRKSNSLKNFITLIIPYVIITFLGFWKVRAFITNLGDEIYSVNQLFYQIFTYLSLAEAGIGLVAIQRYYKLHIEKNHEKINQVYSASKKFLNRVAIFMLVAGFVISFSLKLLTNNSFSLQYLQFVFILYLIRNIVDYFMYAPRFVLQADQKAYKINFWINLSKILESGVEIFLLYLKVNYIILLIPAIFIRFIYNLIINRIVKKEYPWLEVKKKPDMSLIKGTKDFLAYKISDVVYNNTDIILISAFLKPIHVVIYSSYNYIVKVVTEIINQFIQAIVPSLGNAINKEKIENSYTIFEEMNSFFSMLSIFSVSCILILVNKFIVLWIGEDKLLGIYSLLIMVATLFNLLYLRVVNNVVEIKGWFKYSRNISIANACINIVLSIILVKYFGIFGVVLATLIANILTNFWFYPVYIYKNLFKKSPIRFYFDYTLDLIMAIIISIIGMSIMNKIVVNNYIIWVLYAIIVALIVMTITVIYKLIVSKYFRSFTLKIKDMIKKIFNNRDNITDNKGEV